MQKGELTADQANVQLVRIKRVRLVIGRMVAPVRKVLNEAVKRGELGHVMKDGHKPEAYYHPTFKYLADQERRNYERDVLKALAGVVARPFEQTEGSPTERAEPDEANQSANLPAGMKETP